MDELERALDLAGSMSAELQELGYPMLERLYRAGRREAGLALARYVVMGREPIAMGKMEAVSLLADEVRATGCGSSFLNIYYHGGEFAPDDLIGELLPYAAPNSTEAREIWEAKLPGWRHPLA